MNVFLSELKNGSHAKIVGYKENTNLKIKRRLLELGFLSGTQICLSQTSLLNEVFLIEINDYMISLRKSIANCIVVSPQNGEQK